MHTKGERGALDCATPCGHGSRGCILLNLGDGAVRDPGNGSGPEQGSFLLVRVSFYGPGLNFDISEMIYINIDQGFPTCGPRAACSPRGNTVWPVKSYTFE